MKNYRNSRQYLAAAFYLGVIGIFLVFLILCAGILMKSTDLLGWEIAFYMILSIHAVIILLSLVLFVVGIRRLNEENHIEDFINSQEEGEK